ncbi:MAG: flagellar filament capping protein FliD [Eubacteriales bacterium]|nr:flagellar filament capping protein FliD [Eubacteriales bacterium]
MANFNISSFFNNFKSDGMSSFNFSEYASIKNGTYRKLVKANYGKQKNMLSTSTDKKNNKLDATDKTGITKLKTETEELKTAVKAFEKDDLWKQKNGSYDTEKITKAVKSFVNAYNDVVDQSSKVKAKDVSLQTGFMTNLSKTMKNSLSKVGITVEEDGKMSVDEDALKKADMKDVKAVFAGKYSYATQVADKAGAISSAALRSSSTYGSNGSLSSALSGMFNDWI